MNPLIIRVGIGVVVTAVGFLAMYLKTRKARMRTDNYKEGPYGNFDGENQNICLICLEQFSSSQPRNDLRLPCRHRFHKGCIKHVFLNEERGHRSCPACRAIFSDHLIDPLLGPRDGGESIRSEETEAQNL